VIDMRYLVSPLLLVLVVVPAAAGARTGNSPSVQNAVYFELLGNGGLYSLNVDRKVTDQAILRVGVARWSAEPLFGGTTRNYTTFPLMGAYLLGSGNSRLEVGAGILLGKRGGGADWSEVSDSAIFNLTTTLGYRYQTTGPGFMFRTGLTPMYSMQGDYPDPGFFLSAGISVGFSL
jgi:hypothetical protein